MIQQLHLKINCQVTGIGLYFSSVSTYKFTIWFIFRFEKIQWNIYNPYNFPSNIIFLYKIVKTGATFDQSYVNYGLKKLMVKINFSMRYSCLMFIFYHLLTQKVYLYSDKVFFNVIIFKKKSEILSLLLSWDIYRYVSWNVYHIYWETLANLHP